MQIFELFGSILLKDEGATTQLDAINERASSVGKSMGTVFSNMKVAFGAVGLIASTYLTGAVESASKAQKANSDLEATIKSTGGAAGVTAKQVIDMASGLSKVSLFSGTAIKTGEAMLLTFTNIGRDVLPAASQAMLDLAQKMGGDPVDQAVKLGKALNDPSNGLTALTKVGVTFTEQQKNQVKAMQASGDMAGAQKIILAELSKEFGGQALAATKTYDGQIQMMTKSLAGIKTSIGTAVLPYLQKMVEGIQGVITPITNFIQNNSQLAAVILSLTAGFGLLVGGAGIFQKVMGILGPVVSGISTALEGMMLPVLAITAGIVLLGVAYATNFGGMKTTVDGFINGAMKVLQQVFKDVQAWIVANWPMIKATFEEVFQDIKNVWDSVLKPTLLFILTQMGDLVSWVKDNWPEIKATFETIFQGIKSLWENVLKPVLQFIVKELGVVVAWVKDNWPEIRDTVKIVFEEVKSIVTTIMDAVLSVIKLVGGAILSFWKAHWDTIKTVLSAAWDIIKTVVDTVIHVVMDIIKVVMDIINGKWGEAWNDLVDAVKSIFTGVIQIIKDILVSVSTVFSDIANTAINWGENLINGFIKGIMNKVEAVKAAAQAVISAAAGFMGFHSPSKEGEGRHIIEWGENMIEGFMGGIRSKLPDMQALMASVIKSPTLTSNVNLGFSGSGMPGAIRNTNTETVKNTVSSVSESTPINKGITQRITINSPVALSPSETVRQLRIAMQQLALQY